MGTAGRALVTGAAGFIGRHLCRELAAAGWQVKEIDRDAGIDVRRDMREYNGHWDAVIHLAAIVGGRKVMNGAPLAHAANLAIDASFFRWCEIARPGRVVYFSSSCAYPVAITTTRAWKLKESFLDLRYPMLADQLYGWAKLTGEMLAAELAAGGLEVTVVRPFSVYGPGMNDGFAIPSFTAQAARKASPLMIWGDAGQVRDYIHVTDVARAVVALLAAPAGTYNLGTGEGTSLQRLAVMIADQAGYKPLIQVDTGKPAGPPYLVADTARLDQVYRPTVELPQGLKELMR
jgi:nucleoside-diphosphate-sugar epimerase